VTYVSVTNMKTLSLTIYVGSCDLSFRDQHETSKLM